MLVYALGLFLIFQKICVAAGGLVPLPAPCFSYEVFDHPALLPALNQALVNYDYNTISARNAAIPALDFPPPHIGAIGAGPNPLRIGVSRGGNFPVAWNHNIQALAPGPLTIVEAATMALERPRIGIPIEFNAPHLLVMIAAGAPLGPGEVAQVQRALRRGGYLTPLAAAIYRLRRLVPFPNVAAIDGGGVANGVVMHFHLPIRVSKNVRELSINSLQNPAIAGFPPYLSIKDSIDNQFVALGLPRPHSATIVSSDILQR